MADHAPHQRRVRRERRVGAPHEHEDRRGGVGHRAAAAGANEPADAVTDRHAAVGAQQLLAGEHEDRAVRHAADKAGKVAELALALRGRRRRAPAVRPREPDAVDLAAVNLRT